MSAALFLLAVVYLARGFVLRWLRSDHPYTGPQANRRRAKQSEEKP